MRFKSDSLNCVLSCLNQNSPHYITNNSISTHANNPFHIPHYAAVYFSTFTPIFRINHKYSSMTLSVSRQQDDGETKYTESSIYLFSTENQQTYIFSCTMGGFYTGVLKNCCFYIKLTNRIMKHICYVF